LANAEEELGILCATNHLVETAATTTNLADFFLALLTCQHQRTQSAMLPIDQIKFPPCLSGLISIPVAKGLTILKSRLEFMVKNLLQLKFFFGRVIP